VQCNTVPNSNIAKASHVAFYNVFTWAIVIVDVLNIIDKVIDGQRCYSGTRLGGPGRTFKSCKSGHLIFNNLSLPRPLHLEIILNRCLSIILKLSFPRVFRDFLTPRRVSLLLTASALPITITKCTLHSFNIPYLALADCYDGGCRQSRVFCEPGVGSHQPDYGYGTLGSDALLYVQ
jgi:hypothetical protein